MATTISAFSSLHPFCRAKSISSSSSSSNLPLGVLRIQNYGTANYYSLNRSIAKKVPRERKVVRSVAEETLIPPGEKSTIGEEGSTTAEQTVSVQVSPSDVLTMFFQAEGTMNETAIPTVGKALEETEGISNLKVQLIEGIASVELTKQTTVQTTGVASGLLEIIQGSGFKLQSLNLSFEDEEDVS